MYFLPAIDILNGQAVRLERGDYNKVTVFHDDPAQQAQLFEEDGATWLHVVDLDGAREGSGLNRDVIKRILQLTQLNVEVGGGLRTLDDLRAMADLGVARMVLGTALVTDPDLAQAAREEFGPDTLAAGIDAKNGDVKVEGWVQGAGISALELAGRMAAMGYEHLIYTDIARDGMRTGIAPAAYVEMRQAFGNPVIASGGVSTLGDIRELAKVSEAIEGVIAGRAIYDGAFSVADAVAVCHGTLADASGFLEGLERPIALDDLS